MDDSYVEEGAAPFPPLHPLAGSKSEQSSSASLWVDEPPTWTKQIWSLNKDQNQTTDITSQNSCRWLLLGFSFSTKSALFESVRLCSSSDEIE